MVQNINRTEQGAKYLKNNKIDSVSVNYHCFLILHNFNLINYNITTLYVISVQKRFLKSTTWRHKLDTSMNRVSCYKYDRWGAMSGPPDRPVILGQAVFPWGSTWELLARYSPQSRLKNLIGRWHWRKLAMS